MMPRRAYSKITVVAQPDRSIKNQHYVSNQPPLRKSALIKLPIGSIHPKGWLKTQLTLQANGFHGNLGEISQFLKKKNNFPLDHLILFCLNL